VCISGPLAGNVLAGRLSISGTLRDGMVQTSPRARTSTIKTIFGTRAQLLYRPDESFSLRIVADYKLQQSADLCCAQGFVRVCTTLKPAGEDRVRSA
jgi:iron complex outermembrane recepter protein